MSGVGATVGAGVEQATIAAAVRDANNILIFICSQSFGAGPGDFSPGSFPAIPHHAKPGQARPRHAIPRPTEPCRATPCKRKGRVFTRPGFCVIIPSVKMELDIAGALPVVSTMAAVLNASRGREVSREAGLSFYVTAEAHYRRCGGDVKCSFSSLPVA